MIKSFGHKGIAAYFETGIKSGIQGKHAEKLRVQLTALNAATRPEDKDAILVDYQDYH
jgi:proteic killer suppression protein